MKKQQKSERFNLGTSNDTSVLEIINAVKRISGKDIKVEYAERRAGDPARLIGGNGKAKELLGWKTKYSDIDTIITTALEWQKMLIK